MSDPVKVFSEAVTRLNIKSTDAPRLFQVTRQTFSNWLHGKTQPPAYVFQCIVEMENDTAQRITDRMAELHEIIEKKKKRRKF